MSKTSNDALALAKTQVGYREGRSNGDWNNQEKYAAQVPGLAWANGYAWCAVFVSWLLYMVGALTKLQATASVADFLAQGKQLGRFTEYPTKGAIVIYGKHGDTHTGMCNTWDDSYEYAYEGNTNDDGSSEGNGTYYKRRLRADSFVYGYVIPFYDEYCKSADPNWNGKWLGAGPEPTGVSKAVVKTTTAVKTAINKAVSTVSPTKVAISLAALQAAATHDPKRAQGGITAGADDDVRAVEGMLWQAGHYDHIGAMPGSTAKDGSYGEDTIAAYKAWQVHCGYKGADADGIPGADSLQKLIDKYGRGRYVRTA